MKKLKYIPFALILCFVVFWVGSIVKCELLTSRHISEFTIPNEVTAWAGKLKNTKLLDYSSIFANVYHYDVEGGFNIKYVKHGDRWKMETWSTVWSKSGSADEFIWPYFWHSAEGVGLLIVIGVPAFIISAFVLCLGNRKKEKLQE